MRDDGLSYGHKGRCKASSRGCDRRSVGRAPEVLRPVCLLPQEEETLRGGRSGEPLKPVAYLSASMSALRTRYLPLWILGSVLFLFGAYVAVCNWAALFLNTRNKKRGILKRYSQGPVIGPVGMYLGLKAFPIEKPPWIWAVLLLDPSTWVVVVSLAFLIQEGYRSGKPVGVEGGRTPRERLARFFEQVRQRYRARRR